MHPVANAADHHADVDLSDVLRVVAALPLQPNDWHGLLRTATLNRLGAWIECRPHEDRDLQHRQCASAADEPARLAARGIDRRGLPAGTEAGRQAIPGGGDPARGLSGCLAG